MDCLRVKGGHALISLRSLDMSHAGTQALAAVLLPTTAVYILEQQARWRFLLGEIKGKA